MKKKILLVAGSLLAISNMIYAQDLSNDELISLFRSNDYSKDDLTVNLREKKISKEIPTKEQPQSSPPKRVEKVKELSTDQYIYQYRDSNGVTVISNKIKDSSFKLISVTRTSNRNNSKRDIVNPVLPKNTKYSTFEPSATRITFSE